MNAEQINSLFKGVEQRRQPLFLGVGAYPQQAKIRKLRSRRRCGFSVFVCTDTVLAQECIAYNQPYKRILNPRFIRNLNLTRINSTYILYHKTFLCQVTFQKTFFCVLEILKRMCYTKFEVKLK